MIGLWLTSALAAPADPLADCTPSAMGFACPDGNVLVLRATGGAVSSSVTIEEGKTELAPVSMTLLGRAREVRHLVGPGTDGAPTQVFLWSTPDEGMGACATTTAADPVVWCATRMEAALTRPSPVDVAMIALQGLLSHGCLPAKAHGFVCADGSWVDDLTISGLPAPAAGETEAHRAGAVLDEIATEARAGGKTTGPSRQLLVPCELHRGPALCLQLVRDGQLTLWAAPLPVDPSRSVLSCGGGGAAVPASCAGMVTLGTAAP